MREQVTASPYIAPRFWAYFKKIEERPMFLMPRRQWEAIKAPAGQRVWIDVSDTPMARLATKSDLAAVVAECKSDYEGIITIYRHDPKDPMPINVDRYLVWERVPDHRDFFAMVNSASTSDNANMRGFLADHVFLAKEKQGHDHWLPALPAWVEAVVHKRR